MTTHDAESLTLGCMLVVTRKSNHMNRLGMRATYEPGDLAFFLKFQKTLRKAGEEHIVELDFNRCHCLIDGHLSWIHCGKLEILS